MMIVYLESKNVGAFLISNFRRVLNFVCFLLGKVWFKNSPSLLAQAIFEPNLFPMNTPSFLNIVILHLSAYEDGTGRVFRNVGI
jgi:hypothetical protein